MQTVGGTLKPLQCTGRHYPKGTFTPQRLEPRAGYIKLSSLPWKGTQKITPKKERDNYVFLIIPYLSHNLVLTLASKVLWQAPHRWSLTPEGVSLIIQASKPEVESPWVFITWVTKLLFIKGYWEKESSMNGLLGLNKIIISSKNRGCPLLVVDDVKFVITDCKVKKDLKMWGTSPWWYRWGVAFVLNVKKCGAHHHDGTGGEWHLF